MAEKWIQKAIKKPGALHKELHVPEGKKIPAKKLAAAAKKGGKEGKRARLAETLKKMHKGKQMKNSVHYENEMERPKVPKGGHQEKGMGCHEFKGEAMDIAYGQAGEGGCKSDSKKIMGQMKHYDWEGPSEY